MGGQACKSSNQGSGKAVAHALVMLCGPLSSELHFKLGCSSFIAPTMASYFLVEQRFDVFAIAGSCVSRTISYTVSEPVSESYPQKTTGLYKLTRQKDSEW